MTQYIHGSGGQYGHPRFQPTTGFDQMPFMGSALGQMAVPFMQPYVAGHLQNVGMTPYGLGGTNLYDRMRAMQQTEQMQQTVQFAAQMERANWERTMQGVHRLQTLNPTTGQSDPWTAGMQQHAQTVSGAMANFAPTAAMVAPDWLRDLGGQRGSATLMAMNLAEMSRYRLDPVTGKPGFSFRSNQVMLRQFQDQMFAQPDWHARTMGFSQDQVGEAMLALEDRGMVAHGGRFDTRVRDALWKVNQVDSGRFGKLMSDAGMSGRQLETLSQGELQRLSQAPEVQYEMRTNDSARMMKTFDRHKRTLAAAADIFGEMGRPDAPLQEIVGLIDKLTRNGAQSADPDTLAMKVRQFHQIAKGTVGTMKGLAMANEAAHILGQASAYNPVLREGGNAVLDVAAAGMAATSAYNSAGLGAYSTWGQQTREQFANSWMIKAAKGQGSFMANQLSAVMRASTQIGFKEGTAAGAMAEAIKRGESTFVDPATGKTVNMATLENPELAQIVSAGTGGALSQGAFGQWLGQTGANREYGDKFSIGNIAAGSQAEEQLQNRMGAALFASESVLGAKTKEERAEAQAAGSAMVGLMRGLNSQERAGSNRNKVLATRARSHEAFAPWIARMKAEGKTEEEIDKALATHAESVVGAIDQDQRNAEVSETATGEALWQQLDPEAATAMRDARARAMAQGVAAESFTALGKGSLVARAIDAIQSGGSLQEVIGSALGGIKDSAVQSRIKGTMNYVREIEQSLTADERAILAMPESMPEEADAKRKAMDAKPRLKSLAKALNTMQTDLVNYGKRMGKEPASTVLSYKEGEDDFQFHMNEDGQVARVTHSTGRGAETTLDKADAEEVYGRYESQRDAGIRKEMDEGVAAEEKVESSGGWLDWIKKKTGIGSDNSGGSGMGSIAKIVIEGTLTEQDGTSYRLNGRGGAPVAGK